MYFTGANGHFVGWFRVNLCMKCTWNSWYWFSLRQVLNTPTVFVWDNHFQNKWLLGAATRKNSLPAHFKQIQKFLYRLVCPVLHTPRLLFISFWICKINLWSSCTYTVCCNIKKPYIVPTHFIDLSLFYSRNIHLCFPCAVLTDCSLYWRRTTYSMEMTWLYIGIGWKLIFMNLKNHDVFLHHYSLY